MMMESCCLARKGCCNEVRAKNLAMRRGSWREKVVKSVVILFISPCGEKDGEIKMYAMK